MKPIQKPPEWSRLFADKGPTDVIKFLRDPKVKDLIERTNDKYLHWHEFRYRPMPEGIDPELAWVLVKISRFPQTRSIPLKSIQGRKFSYWLPDCVQKELHTIDQNATGQILVDEPTGVATDKDRYIISSLMEEAIASSILEGAATTRRKAKEMLREGRRPRNNAERMILNNFETMRSIKERSSHNLSIDMLLELQASITQDTLDDPGASGRFRREDEDIRVVDMVNGQLLHIPPKASNLQSRVQSLCDFANDTSGTTFIHPVIKGIILHFWLAYEHPFVDGNGRTARALFYWYLLKEKYWLIEYLPISRIILKAPAKYRDAFLYSETDDEDLTYFIAFHLRAFRLSLEALRIYIAKKQQEIRGASQLLRRVRGLNHRQQELVRHAINHPDQAYTIARHRRTHGVVYQTARTDLLQLVERGLFKTERFGHTNLFLPHDKLAEKLRLGTSQLRKLS